MALCIALAAAGQERCDWVRMKTIVNSLHAWVRKEKLVKNSCVFCGRSCCCGVWLLLGLVLLLLVGVCGVEVGSVMSKVVAATMLS